MSNGLISRALSEIAPGAQWALNGDDVSGLVWLDKIIARPKDSAISAKAAEIKARPRVEVMPDISDRQFAQQLAILGTITEDEAIAWAARGDLPAALEQAIATLPEAGGVQFTARMLLSSATTYERRHPMTDTLGAILGYDAAALDALWRAAAAL